MDTPRTRSTSSLHKPARQAFWHAVLVAVLGFALGGCALYGQVGIDYPSPAPRAEQSKKASKHARGKQFNIPPGHMPPRGMCRIWYYDRPPGHQPAPGDCKALRYRVPDGATLIRG